MKEREKQEKQSVTGVGSDLDLPFLIECARVDSDRIASRVPRSGTIVDGGSGIIAVAPLEELTRLW